MKSTVATALVFGLAVVAFCQGPPQMLLKVPGHASDPKVSLSLDGKYAVTFDKTLVAKVWDQATGEHLVSRAVGVERADGLCLQSENAMLLVNGNQLQVVSLPDFGVLRSVGTPGPSKILALTPNGNRVACRFFDRVTVYDVKTLQQVVSIPTASGSANVAVSQNADFIAVQEFAYFAVYGIDGQRKGTAGDSANGCAMSPDGKLLATQSTSSVIVWDWATSTPVAVLRSPGTVTGVAWSPRGDLVATTSDVVRLWSTANWSVVKDFAPGNGAASQPRFSQEGESLFIGERSGAGSQLSVPDLARQRSYGVIEGDWQALELSTDGRFAAVNSRDGFRLAILDRITGEQKMFFPATGGFFTPECSTFVWIPGEDQVIYINPSTGNFMIADVSAGTTVPVSFLSPLSFPSQWSTTAMRVIPGTSKLLLADGYKVTLVDLKTRLVLWRRSYGNGNPVGIVCSSDGRLFALVDPSVINVCRTQDGAVVKNMGQASLALAAEFTPDSSRFVLGRLSGSVEFFDTTSWSLDRSFQTGLAITSLEFSPGGGQLAIGSRYNEFRFFDPLTGARTEMYDQETYFLWSMRYTSDGKELVIARLDGLIFSMPAP